MQKELIAFKSVYFTYADGRDFKIDNLRFQIQSNTITSILGRNGVGKTTLLLLILGFNKPTCGEIDYSFSQTVHNADNLQERIAYLPQIETAPLSMRIHDYLLLGRIPFVMPFSIPDQTDIDIVKKYEEMLAISDLSNSKLGEISGGELQRVRLARALVQESDLILLDEPMTHLDLNAKYAMMDMIKKLQSIGKTIIFSTHDPIEALRISDHSLLILKEREYIFGKTKITLTNHHLSRCFDIPINIRIIDNEYSIIVES